MIPASETIAIREEHETLKQRVAHLAIKYEDQYPDLLQNYTLAMLLYLREYGPQFQLIDPFKPFLKPAAEGELVNFTSLHRAITATKKDFQSPQKRRAGLEREEAWTMSFKVDAEGW